GNCGLSLGNERPRARGQVDIHARAEPDHADALTGGDRCTLAHETDNSPRDQTRDLYHTDATPVAHDEQAVAFVALARLVEVGTDEGAGMIDHPLDRPLEWAAIHMAIEHAHEDRHPWQRPLAQFELFRRHRVDDAAHPPVGGSNDDAIALRRHARGVAKKIGAPERCQEAKPAEWRPQPEQQQAHHREGSDEAQTLAVDRRPLGAEGGKNPHAHSAAPAPSTGGRARALSVVSEGSSSVGGLRLGAMTSSSTSASFSRAAAASRCRFHMLA